MIKLLDLCCKAGGCSMGYKLAADELGLEIDIVGIDIEPQPNYPFKFIQYDGIQYLKKNYKKFTHVHASPPCQKYSRSTKKFRDAGKDYPDLVEDFRKQMIRSQLPSIIENVPDGSAVRPDIILEGHLFGLPIIRRRYFECVNWFMMKPGLARPKGSTKEGDYATICGNGSSRMNKKYKPYKGIKTTINEAWKEAMGIDWMNNNELSNAIPPAYTKYIGIEFFKH